VVKIERQGMFDTVGEGVDNAAHSLKSNILAKISYKMS